MKWGYFLVANILGGEIDKILFLAPEMGVGSYDFYFKLSGGTNSYNTIR